MTLRASLQSKLGRTRRADRRRKLEAELAVPDCPESLRYLWDTHCRLRRRKGGNGFGYVPLELADFDAFQRLFKTELSPFEWSLIEQIDDLFVYFRNKPPLGGDAPPNGGKET